MGLFGGGNSKSTTINEDNRSIVDYSNAMFNLDSSQDNSNTLDGDYNNNSGSITVTDGGAFDLAGSVTGEAINGMAYVAGNAIDANAGVASNALDYGSGVFDTAALVVDGANARTLDAALATYDNGQQILAQGTSLARDLATLNAEQQADNNASLSQGFSSFMQYADNISRSDGSKLAETNMKTVGIIALALVAGVYFMRGA